MRRLAWLAALVVALIALVIGTTDRSNPSAAERVDHIAATVRCPACRGESARDSNAPAAANVRAEIARRVRAGQSDDQIRDALVAAYGDSILLTPPRSGWGGLVWVLPVMALVCGLAGVAFAFRRWRVEAA
ncbi:MAG: cytochrome c-type biogenesis protein CcmH [Acidobacteria bacterium]|nr:cytochrome c-type biogenesis protein CcmH [Acidobacteriota bacterium]